jgi:hypothetical protein
VSYAASRLILPHQGFPQQTIITHQEDSYTDFDVLDSMAEDKSQASSRGVVGQLYDAWWKEAWGYLKNNEQ